MATRNTKTQTASAIPEAPLEAEVSSMEMLRSMAAMAGIAIPTGREMLVCLTTSFLVGVAGAYATSALASYVAVGALVLTGSAFLALIAMILTYVVGIYLTLKVTARIGVWIASGNVKSDAVAVKNWATDKLSGFKARLSPSPVGA